MKFRIEKTNNYTVMCNFHLKEKQMSLKAKGLLSLMLSLPDDWDYSRKGLIALNTDKEDSIVTALKELKKFGYLVINKLLPNETKSGRFEYEYVIYEVPQKQAPEKQSLEKQAAEIQSAENPPTNKILNNKVLSNKILNNNTTTIEGLDDSMVSQVVEGYDSWGCKVSVILLISNSQLADLNTKLSQDELYHYLEKMQHMLTEDYRFPCSHYDYILKMVMEDRRLKNG